MGSRITYPTEEKIIEYNLLALTLIKAKKADRPKVLSRDKLCQIVVGCKEQEGDIYEKAVYLFKGLIKLHPFESGNRRTAFVTVKAFLLENNRKFNIENDPKQARRMLGVREGYYTDDEIREWIKNGTIKEFKR